MRGYAVVRLVPNNFRFSKLHESFYEAKIECERLCIAEGDVFLVLKVMGRCQPQKPPVEWISND